MPSPFSPTTSHGQDARDQMLHDAMAILDQVAAALDEMSLAADQVFNLMCELRRLNGLPEAAADLAEDLRRDMFLSTDPQQHLKWLRAAIEEEETDHD